MKGSLFRLKFKNDQFWPKLTQIWPKFGHSGYRSSICPLVPAFIEVRSLLFPETLQLVRTHKGRKNVSNAFLKNVPFFPFWPKTIQS